jgi:hypothetical protein
VYIKWYINIKVMNILEVNSREFRDKQRAYFDLADEGQRVVIRRGSRKAYVLTPVNDDDLYFTPKMLEKIDASIQQAKEGKTTKVSNREELKLFLESL